MLFSTTMCALLGFLLASPAISAPHAPYTNAVLRSESGSNYLGRPIREKRQTNITAAQVQSTSTLTSISNGTITQIQISKLIQQFVLANTSIASVAETLVLTDVKRTDISGAAVTVADFKQFDKIVNVNGLQVDFQQKLFQITQLDLLGTTTLDAARISNATLTNPDQTTVMQIVKVIQDESTVGSTRYLQRNIVANPGAATTSTCMMTDAQALTIGGTASSCMATPTPTANALQVATFEAILSSVEASNPGAIKTATLLSSGAAAPTAPGSVIVKHDPASDLLGNSIAGQLSFC